MYHQPPIHGPPRPESHFESAQDASDIYDYYGRDSIYGGYPAPPIGATAASNTTVPLNTSVQWDDTSSGPAARQGSSSTSSHNSTTSGRVPVPGFGGGLTTSSPNAARRHPSPLRYGAALEDTESDHQEHLDDDDDDTSVGLPYDDNDHNPPTLPNPLLDFSRPASRGPDFERPYSDLDNHGITPATHSASRNLRATTPLRWHDDDGNSYIDDADGVTDSDYHSSNHDTSLGGFPAVPPITLPVSPTLINTSTMESSHAQKARAAGLSPIALASSTASGPLTPSEPPTPITPIISKTSAESDRENPTPVSSLPAHVRTVTPEYNSNSLSPTHSTSTSPVHPSITRIYTGPRIASGGSESSRSGPVSGANSNASLVSSQYPGEDPDAYHVRSTYARLEVEGVFGDGWDEGVERTRGGAANTTSRVTMVFPSKDAAMTDAERKYISSLDRYGFVDTPTRSRSEGRLAQVPAAPFGKVPKLQVKSSLGVPRPATPAMGMTPPNAPPPPSPQVPTESRSEPTPKVRKKEEERVVKWMKMMSVGSRDAGRNIISWKWSTRGEGAKHPTRIYKGVPDRWRMAAWWTLAEDKAMQAGRQPSHETLENDYIIRRDGPSESDVQIDLDVPRTISGHSLFRTRFGHGQRALFHVLHSFSKACDTCGYCQGMGSIAATLLCYYEPERAYSLLVRLHDLYDMHGIFAPGFPGLLETFYVQERLLEALMPDVYESFQRNMISSSAWGAKIYITLFVNVVPFNVQLRLWDAMFLDGYNVMVMAVMALLWAYRPLLAAPGATFESILSLLSSFYVPEDEDAMLQWIRKMLSTPGTKERMAGWRREWKSLVEKGQTDGVLL